MGFRIEIARIPGREAQPVAHGQRGLKSVRESPMMGTAQFRREVGGFSGERKAGKQLAEIETGGGFRLRSA